MRFASSAPVSKKQKPNFSSALQRIDEQDYSDKSWWEKFRIGFDRDFGAGGEDMRKVGYLIREMEGKQAEAPKMGNMIVSWLTGQRARDFAGMAKDEGIAARKIHDIALSDDAVVRAGQAVGTIAGDLTQDATRRFYWLLNALQATGEVINEEVLTRANDKLYGKHAVGFNTNPPELSGGRGEGLDSDTIKRLRRERKLEAVDAGFAHLKGDDRETLVPRRGYSIQDDGEILKRNFDPGYIQALSWPTGIAINTGLGLMTPFGGAEGYKAAIPSEDDPTKTANMLGEVGLKYIMGRTGQLLPYEDFKKVRPDVSKDEYMRYKAFKYDKEEDWNPMDDGDATIGSGALKFTDEGIHGPEVQFLGRSLPMTTGAVPFGGALLGGAMGVRTERPIRGGFLGGMAGLAVGQVAGNLLEQERRRRNTAENELQNPQVGNIGVV